MHVLQSVRVAIHSDGWPFIGVFAIIAAVLSAISCVLGFVGWIVTAWCVYFFRDPDRVIPTRPGLIVSPADGIVQMIADVEPPAELQLPPGLYTRISIFLNVFDVHINRLPIGGTITHKVYVPGKFINASLDKASLDNERLGLKIKMDDGREIAVVQIAGLVARRIVSWVDAGQTLKTGERFGMIRFGSRADVYLPADIAPQVVRGQRMIGGESIIADLTASEPARQGEVR
ncbi:MAG: phosphatidylserine decarboxylase [Bdellovibrionales bacterium]